MTIPDYEATSASGHSPSDNESVLLEYIEQISKGNYLVDIQGNSPVAKALQKLAAGLQRSASADLDNVVKLSMCSNETSISSARLLYNLKNVEERAHSIATAADQMRTSSENIRSYGEEINEATSSSIKVVSAVSTSLEKSVSAFDEISTSVADNRTKILEMSQFALQVREIADEIKGIAFQTNLLALNASVEAARAGTAGAGFSVVAQEMRMLSDRSSSATRQITELVDHFENHMNEVSTALQSSVETVNAGKTSINQAHTQMGDMKSSINNVFANMTHINKAIAEQTQASSDVANGIGIIAENTTESVSSTDHIVDSIDALQGLVNQKILKISELQIPSKVIKLAQSDHVIWKKRLVNMISGKEGLDEMELADHHSCRLGKWYDKVADSTLTSSREFRELKEPHRLVHEHGKRSVALFNRGDIKGALKEIEYVESASVDVLRLLKSIERLA